jgi:hypothetical protein
MRARALDYKTVGRFPVSPIVTELELLTIRRVADHRSRLAVQKKLVSEKIEMQHKSGFDLRENVFGAFDESAVGPAQIAVRCSLILAENLETKPQYACRSSGGDPHRKQTLTWLRAWLLRFGGRKRICRQRRHRTRPGRA